MSVLDIVDELAALFEPDAGARDDAAARPVEYEPDLLYAWPRSEVLVRDGTGELDRENWSVRVAWVTAEDMAAGSRTRYTSDAIVAKADAIGALVRQNRSGDHYEWSQVDAIDYEALTTLEYRGFVMDLSGYCSRSD